MLSLRLSKSIKLGFVGEMDGLNNTKRYGHKGEVSFEFC